MGIKEYYNCNLCARKCGINRYERRGACGMMNTVFISRAALHAWEEPPISGTNGSGTIFFSGCSLSCIYCQNSEISRGRFGKEVTIEHLCDIMLRLQKNGAHNINFVTPTHYAPSVRESVRLARAGGLSIPIVYNTGGYDTPETIKMLDGTVDIYLADMKYIRSKTAKEYSNAENYPSAVKCAIEEMVRQTGACRFDQNGIMTRGTIVRILLLPGHVAEAKLILKYLYDTYGDKIFISLMNQYTPKSENLPTPLFRKVTRAEYDQLVSYAEKIGVKNGFTQQGEAASESFIPAFDLTGV